MYHNILSDIECEKPFVSCQILFIYTIFPLRLKFSKVIYSADYLVFNNIF